MNVRESERKFTRPEPQFLEIKEQRLTWHAPIFIENEKRSVIQGVQEESLRYTREAAGDVLKIVMGKSSPTPSLSTQA